MRKICLFAHFDPQGRIDPYVRHYLRALADLGFDIVLVSAAPSLHQADLEAARPLCRSVIRRENAGFDFGSWKAATEALPDVWDYDRVLLANDSVFGPFSELEPVLGRMESAPELVCGLNDSHEIAHHLQSFFLYFKRPVFAHPAFRGYWEELRPSEDKDFVIVNYEVGLSRRLAEHGVAWRAAFPYDEVRRRAEAMGPRFQYQAELASPLNATLFMWDILLADFGYPFIKTEVLKTNRFASRAVASWQRLLPPSAAAAVADVERYLDRMRRRRDEPERT